MTNATPNRFRLRFSIRTLVIFVTLVCCYAACWGPTKRQGVKDAQSFHRKQNGTQMMTKLTVFAPLFISVDGVEVWDRLGGPSRSHYFWFFGYVAKLPWERESDLQSYSR